MKHRSSTALIARAASAQRQASAGRACSPQWASTRTAVRAWPIACATASSGSPRQPQELLRKPQEQGVHVGLVLRRGRLGDDALPAAPVRAFPTAVGAIEPRPAGCRLARRRTALKARAQQDHALEDRGPVTVLSPDARSFVPRRWPVHKAKRPICNWGGGPMREVPGPACVCDPLIGLHGCRGRRASAWLWPAPPRARRSPRRRGRSASASSDQRSRAAG